MQISPTVSRETLHHGFSSRETLHHGFSAMVKSFTGHELLLKKKHGEEFPWREFLWTQVWGDLHRSNNCVQRNSSPWLVGHGEEFLWTRPAAAKITMVKSFSGHNLADNSAEAPTVSREFLHHGRNGDGEEFLWTQVWGHLP